MSYQYAALFPGQGSQFPGMAETIKDETIAVEIFEKANSALGYDIKDMCLNADADTLKLTANAQPCIYTVSYIAYRLFRNTYTIDPAFVAGHSLGEYTALAAAGVIKFTDGLLAVRNRGLFMQEAVPVNKGAMAAILGADPDELTKKCNELSDNSEVVSPANFNCTGQIVVSGHKNKVEALLRNYKGKMLEVSAPFHSQLMQPAADKMKTLLLSTPFNHATFPVVSNIDNEYRTSAESFVPSLISQLTEPVRWETGIKKIIDSGVNRFIEFGPGKVLSGLMKRIDRNSKIHNVLCKQDIDNLEAELNGNI